VVRSCGQQARVGGQPAQPAVPADRCAREIVRFLTLAVARLRQLNGNPLGRAIHTPYHEHTCSISVWYNSSIVALKGGSYGCGIDHNSNRDPH
jgi:hypothetical protein